MDSSARAYETGFGVTSLLCLLNSDVSWRGMLCSCLFPRTPYVVGECLHYRSAGNDNNSSEEAEGQQEGEEAKQEEKEEEEEEEEEEVEEEVTTTVMTPLPPCPPVLRLC